MDNSVIVSLRDIVMEFDGQRILDGLNLDIHDKEFVTLLGSSGCGKTTTLRGILALLEQRGEKVVLAAPTGRAAKRMAELTGREASTIHRLLEV